MTGLDLAIVTTDTRLARILAGDNRECAVELWVLQLQIQAAVESRLLYGRVSPFDFSNDRWSSPRRTTSRSYAMGFLLSVRD